LTWKLLFWLYRPKPPLPRPAPLVAGVAREGPRDFMASKKFQNPELCDVRHGIESVAYRVIWKIAAG
jgi:hypothetical protein